MWTLSQALQTPVRLGAHLKHSAECRRGLLNRGVVGPPIPGAGSCVERALATQRDYPLPYQQSAGPLQETVHGDDFPAYSVSLSLAIVDHLFDSANVSQAELMDQIKTVIRRHTEAISWTLCKLTLKQIQSELTPMDFETFPLTFSVYSQTIGALQDHVNWYFLNDHSRPLHDTTTETVRDLEEIFATEQPWRRTTPVPRTFSRHRYFLHCFSGRRRAGDLEHYMRCTQTPEGTTLHVISLDIVIDGELGNLLRKESRSFWLHAIAQGWITGLLCGPPCETWSRARGKAIKGKNSGPRIVRSVGAPWDQTSLGVREAKQVLFGLKEYPPALCRALGLCLGETLSCLEVGADDPPTQFQNRFGKMESADYGLYMGRDYHG